MYATQVPPLGLKHSFLQLLGILMTEGLPSVVTNHLTQGLGPSRLSSICYNKIPSTLWLMQQTFIFSQSKIKVPADLFFGESSLPGLQMATFLLYPCMIKGESSHASSFFL